MPTGSLQALLRYPVKSMAGEALTVARVLPGRGVHGDRALAVQDVETGRVASAKHPRRWGALLDYQARLLETKEDDASPGPVAITLPDTSEVRSDQSDIDRTLSNALGHAVRLIHTPPPQATYDEAKPGQDAAHGAPLAVGAGTGTFFDFAPIHLVTTASLARLQQLRPASKFDVARFRPNLVIDTITGPGFVENEWIGRIIAIGDSVRLFATFPCPRCVMTTLAQGALPADPEVLRTVTRHNRQLFALLARQLPTVGVYATVLQGGTIHPGDPIRLEGRAPLQRAVAFLHAIKRTLWRA